MRVGTLGSTRFHGYFSLLLLLSTNPFIMRTSLHPNLPTASRAVPVGHYLKLFRIVSNSNIPNNHTYSTLALSGDVQILSKEVKRMLCAYRPRKEHKAMKLHVHSNQLKNSCC